jgi:hypothetical protein
MLCVCRIKQDVFFVGLFSVSVESGSKLGKYAGRT